MVTRGFFGRRRDPEAMERLPPGQSLTEGFPVLSAGPTPHIQPYSWSFTLKHGPRPVIKWTWDEFNALPRTKVIKDIHCVTTWSKLGMTFDGVSVDSLLAAARPLPSATHVVAFSHTGYTTNLPLADVTDGKAWVAWNADGKPLTAEHGGPARLLVPHLYFWKSAKWVAGVRVMDHDEPGFWEANGYHNRGDPWREERYWTD